VGECSSRCFQNTQALIFHLASLTGVRDVIIAELKVKAEELGTRILQELDGLSKAVKVAKEGDELPGTITAKFSLPSSNQAKLLRILKTMENIYSTSVPGRSTQAVEPANTDEKVQAIYESLPFGSLWRRLSDCLTAVEERPDATHVATFLLPLMEAVMVICKPFATQTQQAAAARRPCPSCFCLTPFTRDSSIPLPKRDYWRDFLIVYRSAPEGPQFNGSEQAILDERLLLSARE
jgi:E3 ubiquitin-protein ligase HUWE1